MTNENLEIRKIPKKTKIYFLLVVIVGFAYFFISTNLREQKVEEYLYELGYTEITDVTVFGKHEVEDKETRRKGLLYKLEFVSNGMICRGGVSMINKTLTKDIECN